MCGIYASIGFAPDRARIDIVAHRGPDGSGWETFASSAGPVSLGHRRLAIIDTTDAGLQPMADAGRRFHIVFNGEIYNYVELRRELEAKGEVFRTDSDTEVLLRAVMTWGEGALDRLRGMFAFAVWDDARKRLFAARDRFGIKPLYLVEGRCGVAFGSEIKQLLGLERGGSQRMNVARAHDFLATGICDHTRETLFAGIDQIRGGECLTVEASAPRPEVRIRRWYGPKPESHAIGEAEAADRFRQHLDAAVRLHLRADVKVGSCLSGGLDSSSLVCLMARELGTAAGGPAVETVSACYAEKTVDERPFIDLVVAAAGATPHYVFPRAEDAWTRAADVTWHQDEPFGSTSIFAQWCVFETAASAGIKVMLDGQGADEQLAGYHGNGFPFYMAGLVRSGRLGMLARTMHERRRQHGTPLVSQLRGLVPLLPPGLVRHLRRQHHALAEHDWLATDLVRTRGNQAGAIDIAAASMGLPPPSDIASLCRVMTFASNLPMLLHWEDRSSMAHGIEARVPFLDHPLVEFSLALGDRHKLVGADTKRVLRRAMAGVLPQAVHQRRDKLGFATPEEVWFRGPLRPMLRAGIEETLSLYPDLLQAKGVRALAADMLEGRKRLDPTLWRIVNLGIWGRRFGVGL